MATYSNYLGLKLNDESDPFQLADFIQNWGILDASPGNYICTSASRPSWGADQAGRLIFMTDLKQLSYWTGTAWSDLRDGAPVFAGGVYLAASANPNNSSQYSVLTITTPRPCAMAIIMTGTYSFPDNKDQDAWQSITFDGTQQFMGGYRDQIRFSGAAGNSGTPAMGATCTTLYIVPSVAAGQHRIGAQVDVGSYPSPLGVTGFKVLGLIAVYASGNSL